METDHMCDGVPVRVRQSCASYVWSAIGIPSLFWFSELMFSIVLGFNVTLPVVSKLTAVLSPAPCRAVDILCRVAN